MFLIRNATPKDLTSVYHLARHLNSYNLPADRKFLKRFLKIVDRSFRGELKNPEEGKYLFLAEDLMTAKVIGCSLIIAKHGTKREPHLAFKVKKRFFQMVVDTDGPTELGGLVVIPQYRGTPHRIGKQLSWARFLYIAYHPERFQKRFLAEYLPPFQKPGESPFWECVGKKFTGMSYQKADRLSATHKEFVLRCFPKKMDVKFLSVKAKNLLGKVGKQTIPAISMLKKIGFRYLDQVDLFDGGPHFGARWDQISFFQKVKRVEGGILERRGKKELLILFEDKNEVHAFIHIGTVGQIHPKSARKIIWVPFS
jgi:arginine N-succinyltransferase